tara:strand:+ start:2361 stop:3017 length:657 start_codon:yes stop_codon:yes gene_type:complete
MVNNSYKNRLFSVCLLIMFASFITSCSRNNDTETFTKIMRDIDIKNYLKSGDPKFSIKSPESYNINNITVKAISPILIIFEESKPNYKITAKEALIKLDSNDIELFSDVNISDKSTNPLFLKCDYLHWEYNLPEIILKGKVYLKSDEFSLESSSAIFHKEKEEITFHSPVKYQIYKPTRVNKENTVLRTLSESAIYNNKTKRLLFESNKKRVRSLIEI